jgi:hypothetical protein
VSVAVGTAFGWVSAVPVGDGVLVALAVGVTLGGNPPAGVAVTVALGVAVGVAVLEAVGGGLEVGVAVREAVGVALEVGVGVGRVPAMVIAWVALTTLSEFWAVTVMPWTPREIQR